MISKPEFDKLVQDTNALLSSVAKINNNLVKLGVSDSGPLDDEVSDAMKGDFARIRDGMESLEWTRNKLVSTWLRTGASRAEISELTGISVSRLRMMSDAALAGTTEAD